MKRFLVLLLMVLLASCSKNLSRGHAKAMLDNHWRGMVQATCLNIGVIHGQFGPEQLNKVTHPCAALYAEPDFMDRLIAGGFISATRTAYSVEQTWLYTIVYETCDFELTGEGEKYVFTPDPSRDSTKSVFEHFKDMQGKIITFAVAHRLVESVDGITSPSSDIAGRITCTVNYTYKNICTPIANYTYPDLVCNTALKDTATFVLYDDGWRLEGASESSDADKDLKDLEKLWGKIGGHR